MAPRKQYSPMECAVDHPANCERLKRLRSDLVCPGHWALVPKPMKQALWDAQHLRSPKQREWQTIVAASDIIAFLEKKRVILPEEKKILTPGEKIEAPANPAAPRIIRP